jgi:lysophospholipase L1-like esterase
MSIRLAVGASVVGAAGGCGLPFEDPPQSRGFWPVDMPTGQAQGQAPILSAVPSFMQLGQYEILLVPNFSTSDLSSDEYRVVFGSQDDNTSRSPPGMPLFFYKNTPGIPIFGYIRADGNVPASRALRFGPGYPILIGVDLQKAGTQVWVNRVAFASTGSGAVTQSGQWRIGNAYADGANTAWEGRINQPIARTSGFTDKPTALGNWARIGDSLTAGSGGGFSTEGGWRWLAAMQLFRLGIDFVAIGASSGNLGDGEVTPYDLHDGVGGNELDDMLTTVTARVAGDAPDLITVCGGTNDLAAGLTPAQVLARWDAIVDAAAGIDLQLGTIPYRYNNPSFNTLVDTTNALLRAESWPSNVFVSEYGSGFDFASLAAGDGVHPGLPNAYSSAGAILARDIGRRLGIDWGVT